LKEQIKIFVKTNLVKPAYTEEQLIQRASQNITEEELHKELSNRFNEENESLLERAKYIFKSLETQLSHVNSVLNDLRHQSVSTDYFKEMENPKDILKRTFYSFGTFTTVSVVSIVSLGVAWTAIATYLTESGEFVTFYDDPIRAFLFAMPGVTIAFAIKARASLVCKNDAERHTYYRRIIKATLFISGIWALSFALLFGIKQELGFITDTALEPIFGFIFTFTQLTSEILAGAIAWIWSEKINSRNKLVIPVKNPLRLSRNEEVDLHLSELLELQAITGHISGFLREAESMLDAFILSEMRRIYAARQTVTLAKLNAVEDLSAKARQSDASSNITHISKGVH
jgi:hypothetical protein